MEELIRQLLDISRRLDRLETVGEQGPYVPWTDYGGTSTIVGWSSFTTQKIFYTRVGKLIFVAFDLNGTSNATTVSFTLPYARPADSFTIDAHIRRADNGTTATGELNMASGSDTVVCLATIGGSGTSWTASGTKRVIGEFFYVAT